MNDWNSWPCAVNANALFVQATTLTVVSRQSSMCKGIVMFGIRPPQTPPGPIRTPQTPSAIDTPSVATDVHSTLSHRPHRMNTFILEAIHGQSFYPPTPSLPFTPPASHESPPLLTLKPSPPHLSHST